MSIFLHYQTLAITYEFQDFNISFKFTGSHKSSSPEKFEIRKQKHQAW